MDVEHVFLADIGLELADGFKKRQAFDVPDGAPDFNDHHVDAVGRQLDAAFDFVSDVGDHLDGAAEIIPPALLGDDGIVDFAGGEVVVGPELGIGEALVVAEVEIGFGAVVGDEDLPVLKRVHGAGILVDVGVQLLEGDAQPPAFQKGADGGGGQALAQGREHPAGHKNKLGVKGHCFSSSSRGRPR